MFRKLLVHRLPFIGINEKVNKNFTIFLRNLKSRGTDFQPFLFPFSEGKNGPRKINKCHTIRKVNALVELVV